jgi:hypothetical protein
MGLHGAAHVGPGCAVQRASRELEAILAASG